MMDIINEDIIQKILIILKSFNNIEIATAIIIIIFLFSFKSLRTLLPQILIIIKDFLIKNKIIKTLFITLFFIFTVVTVILYNLSLWDISLLKSSITWFLFSGIIIFFDISKNDNLLKIIKDIFIKLISFSVIFEFIVNIYCLPIWVLLFLIPIIVTLNLLNEFLKEKQEYIIAKTFCENILSLLGFILVSYILYKFFNNCNKLFNLETLKDFLLPFFYTPIFVITSIIFKTYSEYETVYKRLKWRTDIRIPVNIIYVFSILKQYKLNFDKLNKFMYFITTSAFLITTTNINDLINEFEKRNKLIPYDNKCIGFDINKTINLLATFQLSIKNYKYIEYDNGYGNYYDGATNNFKTFDFIHCDLEGTNQYLQKISLEYHSSSTTPKNKFEKDFTKYIELCKKIYSLCFNKNFKLTKYNLMENFKIKKQDYIIENVITIYNEKLTGYKLLIYVKKPIISEYYQQKILNL